MHTAEHALKPTVLYGAEELATLAIGPAMPDERPLWRAAVVAVTLASVANALLYLLGTPFDLFPRHVLVPGAGEPVTLPDVVRSTALGAAGGAGVYAVVRRHALDPERAFRRIALAVLLFSFTQPSLVLRDAPLRMVLALDALHVVAALVTLGALRLGRRSPRAGG